MTSIIERTDSYKLTHWNQYPAGTEGVYSYFESRVGAQWDETVFFGLQAILTQINDLAAALTPAAIDEAEALVAAHLGNPALFNRKGWEHIYERGGHLPVVIKAVPEGTPVPVGNVLMTIENTDREAYWLTNYLETMLTHVWYPSTVATLSREVKKHLAALLYATADNSDGIDFMLHDFGFRGATSLEAAAIGGAAHLVNFKGTDTIPGMLLAHEIYGADYADLAFSVPATEHSIMTSIGDDIAMIPSLLDAHPSGILSVVADSYDIYAFVAALQTFRGRIVGRDGVFVVRPDSITAKDPTPADLTASIVDRLWDIFGGHVNDKGYRVLDPHVRVLWGDGIDTDGIVKILSKLMSVGYSAENMVFGMGGGLLQKVNRVTQRFAFKCSAQYRDGRWVDVHKNPLDHSKASKAGRLKLVTQPGGQYATVPESSEGDDVLELVYADGEILRTQSFDDVRERAAIVSP